MYSVPMGMLLVAPEGLGLLDWRSMGAYRTGANNPRPKWAP
jgi:hypothetical protein